MSCDNHPIGMNSEYLRFLMIFFRASSRRALRGGTWPDRFDQGPDAVFAGRPHRLGIGVDPGRQ